MEKKKCRVCGEEKTLDCFNLHHLKGQYKYISDKYRSECKLCQRKIAKDYRERNKEKLRQQRIRRKDKIKAWKEKYYSDPQKKEEARAYSRAYYYKQNGIEKGFNSKLRTRFGITRDQYDFLLKCQNDGCAICGANVARKNAKHLAVDHDHQTGKVRGLLCTRCNRVIGSFQDNPDLLRKAAQYLEQ